MVKEQVVKFWWWSRSWSGLSLVGVCVLLVLGIWQSVNIWSRRCGQYCSLLFMFLLHLSFTCVLCVVRLCAKWRLWKINKTRSTQRAQTSLAEADHYSHIVHCKNVEPWFWKTTHPPQKKKKKKKRKGSGSLPSPRSGYANTITVFFTHLLILQYPDHHQNLISSYLYYSGPVHKISSQSVHNFLSNVVHRQTNRQTNQRYQKHNLLCQGGNK